MYSHLVSLLIRWARQFGVAFYVVRTPRGTFHVTRTPIGKEEIIVRFHPKNR